MFARLELDNQLDFSLVFGAIFCVLGSGEKQRHRGMDFWVIGLCIIMEKL